MYTSRTTDDPSHANTHNMPGLTAPSKHHSHTHTCVNMMSFGIDEAGCGALAGPLLVACVGGLPDDTEWVSKLRDSKKLSEKRRGILYTQIVRDCTWVRTERVSPHAIDISNIQHVNQCAMGRLVRDVALHHTRDGIRIIVDGNRDPIPSNEHVTCLVKADTQIPEVMAASIVAKVSRDREMTQRACSEYAFARHKGYGTSAHYMEINTHGPIPGWHRMSFNLHLIKHVGGGDDKQRE